MDSQNYRKDTAWGDFRVSFFKHTLTEIMHAYKVITKFKLGHKFKGIGEQLHPIIFTWLQFLILAVISLLV